MLKGYYLGAVTELKRREAEYRNSQFKDMFLQVMSVLASHLGNYNEANSYFDEGWVRNLKSEPETTTRLLDTYAPHRYLKLSGRLAGGGKS